MKHTYPYLQALFGTDTVSMPPNREALQMRFNNGQLQFQCRRCTDWHDVDERTSPRHVLSNMDDLEVMAKHVLHKEPSQ